MVADVVWRLSGAGAGFGIDGGDHVRGLETGREEDWIVPLRFPRADTMKGLDEPGENLPLGYTFGQVRARRMRRAEYDRDA